MYSLFDDVTVWVRKRLGSRDIDRGERDLEALDAGATSPAPVAEPAAAAAALGPGDVSQTRPRNRVSRAEPA